MLRKTILVAAALALCAATPAPSISIDGAFAKVASLSAGQIAAMPRSSATVVEEHGDGKPVRFDGVPLSVVLHAAGVPVGGDVKGPAARSYVIVHAIDGYSVVYSLAELESTAAACMPLFADLRASVAMSAPLGPFRLIAPCDKAHARWVHQVTGFTIVTAASETSHPPGV